MFTEYLWYDISPSLITFYATRIAFQTWSIILLREQSNNSLTISCGVECDLIQGLVILLNDKTFRYSQLTRFELLQQPLFLLPCNLCDMSWLWMHQMKKPQETAWCSTHGINLNQGENSLPAKPSLRDELETDWGRGMIKPSEGPSGN